MMNSMTSFLMDIPVLNVDVNILEIHIHLYVRSHCLLKKKKGKDIMNTKKNIKGNTKENVDRLNAAMQLGKHLVDEVDEAKAEAYRPVKEAILKEAALSILSGKLYEHPLFKVYIGMRTRCLSPKHKMYYRYGGRGITICDEWLNDYKAFIYWGIFYGWQPGLQIDREDNSKGYYPANCRFVTPLVNMHNKG